MWLIFKEMSVFVQSIDKITQIISNLFSESFTTTADDCRRQPTKTHNYTHAPFLQLFFCPAQAAGARRRQSSLMNYSSLEFKGSTVGPVNRRPRDGDVSRSFMTLEYFLCVLLMRSRQEPDILEPSAKEADTDSLKTSSDVILMGRL